MIITGGLTLLFVLSEPRAPLDIRPRYVLESRFAATRLRPIAPNAVADAALARNASPVQMPACAVAFAAIRASSSAKARSEALIAPPLLFVSLCGRRFPSRLTSCCPLYAAIGARHPEPMFGSVEFAAAPLATAAPDIADTVAPKTAASAQAYMPWVAPPFVRPVTLERCPANQPPMPKEIIPLMKSHMMAPTDMYRVASCAVVLASALLAAAAPTPSPINVNTSWIASALTVPAMMAGHEIAFTIVMRSDTCMGCPTRSIVAGISITL